MKKRSSYILCALVLLLSPHIGQAAAVSPSLIELHGSRGETIESAFTIISTGTGDQLYFLDLLSFDASDENGTPVFTPEKTDQTPFLSWILFPDEDVIVSGQSKVDVPFKVAIPDDVPSGSYYGAITISTTPSDVVASNGATIEAKMAILVFLTVDGETVEKLEVLDFGVSKRDGTLPFGTFHYRLQNQGNVHLTPKGDIILRNLFGWTVARVDANEALGRVLPSFTRAYDVSIGPENVNWLDAAGYQLKHLLFGPVHVKLDLAYGEEGTVHVQTTIWVVPWQLISVLLAGILVVVLVYKKIATRN